MNKNVVFSSELITKSAWMNQKGRLEYLPIIVIAEFFIIVVLVIRIIKLKSKNVSDVNTTLGSKLDLISDARSGEVDMDDLMMNINRSKELYKKLSSKCHPDRFIDVEKNEIANEIFQNITKNQRNYKQLLVLSEQAQNELNITI